MKNFVKRLLLGLLMTFVATMSPFLWSSEEPWSPQEVLQPQQLAEILKSGTKENQPVLLHVGFQFLYKNGHIPGSLYVGPTNEEKGVKRLRMALEKVLRSRQVVIYCGCCPLSKCPNVRPAFKIAKEMGFTNVRLLHLPENIEKDWIGKGYPIEKR